jgi:hypothetical protein
MTAGWRCGLAATAALLVATIAPAAGAAASPPAPRPRPAVTPATVAGRLPAPAAIAVREAMRTAAVSNAGTLAGVSCRVGAACVAVGWSGSTRTEKWTGSNWTAQPSPLAGRLSAVSCATRTFCVAVGIGCGSAEAEWWNGERWRAMAAGDPAGATSTWLNGVSCTSPVACMAVGLETPDYGRTLRAVAESWNGRRWISRPPPVPPGALFSDLDAVSCSSPDACTAVGSYHGGNYVVLTLAERWDGRGWVLQPTPNPAGRTSDGLLGVSCAAVDDCTAVGNYGTGGGTWRPLAEWWNGARWYLSSPAVPHGATFTQLDAVQCPGGGSCIAVGYETGQALVPEPVAEWDRGGRWVVQPTPPAAGGQLEGVACSHGACDAVGGSRAGLMADSWDGSVWQRALMSPIVAIVAAPAEGYYLVAADGTVWSFGGAPYYGDLAGASLSAPIVAMAADAATGGYWLVGADGGVYAFHAPFYGSTGRLHLARPVVGAAAAPGGDGYRLVASDGGVFAFGPGAHFLGSTGGERLRRPIVGIAVDARTNGYWLVASDGGIFAFGARYYGSTGGETLHRPIVGMQALGGAGYRLVASDGGVFDFGGARYAGSLGSRPPASQIVGVGAPSYGSGYWLAHADGAVNAFGGAVNYGSA